MKYYIIDYDKQNDDIPQKHDNNNAPELQQIKYGSSWIEGTWIALN